jgi:hypothetical protein
MPRNRLTDILADLSNPLNFTPLSGKMTRAFIRIHHYLNSFNYNKPGDKNSLWITRGILNSGLFWENKVLQYLLHKKNGPWKNLISSDLKGLLLFLENGIQGETRNSDDIKLLELKIKQALNIIEQDQFINLSSIKEGLGWLLNIPCIGKDGFRRSEIFIKKNKKGECVSFIIFLELTRLGIIEINVSLIESLIGINLFAEDSGKVAFINDNIHMLEESLKDLGISIDAIHCDIKKIQDDIDSDLIQIDTYHEPSMHLVI